MNRLRSRIALLLLFMMTAKTFDLVIPYRPSGEYWDMAYFGSAMTVDWLMFHMCRRFISGKLCRDVEALCIASIVTNALGFALYMAEYPPSIYNWMILGLNYVLAIRLTLMGGGDVPNTTHFWDLVRGVARGRVHLYSKKENR